MARIRIDKRTAGLANTVLQVGPGLRYANVLDAIDAAVIRTATIVITDYTGTDGLTITYRSKAGVVVSVSATQGTEFGGESTTNEESAQSLCDYINATWGDMSATIAGATVTVALDSTMVDIISVSADGLSIESTLGAGATETDQTTILVYNDTYTGTLVVPATVRVIGIGGQVIIDGDIYIAEGGECVDVQCDFGHCVRAGAISRTRFGLERMGQTLPIPAIAREEPQTPFPAMFAIRIDDGFNKSNWWFTASATWAIGGANASPFRYCQRKGIPISIAMITDQIGASNYLSAQNIIDMYQQGGFEFMAHTGSHEAASQPTDMAGWQANVGGARSAIEAVATSTPVLGGVPCKTWVQSGNWTGNNNLSDITKWNSELGTMIREQFEVSEAYQAGYGGHDIQRHLGGPSFTVDYNEADAAAEAKIDAIVGLAKTPGFKTIVYCHGPHESRVGADVNSAFISQSHFKYLIDSIATARDAGLLMPVTLSMARAGVPAPGLAVDATTGAPVPQRWGGFPFGYMDALPTAVLAKADATWPGQMYFYWGAGQAVTLEASDQTPANPRLGFAQGNVLQIALSGVNDSAYMRARVAAKPGAQYTLSFDHQRVDAHSASLQVNLLFSGEYIDSAGARQAIAAGTGAGVVALDPITNGSNLLTPGTDWVREHKTFGIPTWATSLTVEFKLDKWSSAFDTAAVIQLDNIELVRVGL